MPSDEADALVISTDPLHVRLFRETCTNSNITSVNSPRISFQSCVQGFIGLGGLLAPGVGSVSALGGFSSTLTSGVVSSLLIFSRGFHTLGTRFT